MRSSAPQRRVSQCVIEIKDDGFKRHDLRYTELAQPTHKTSVNESHMNKTLSKITRCFLLLLSAGLFSTTIEAQVLTNRTPDTAKIQPQATPKPSPTPNNGSLIPPDSRSTITPDPALFPPGTFRGPIPESETAPAYYVLLRGVTGLLVSDAKGRTDNLFPPSGFAFKVVEDATYDPAGDHSMYVTVPVGETYTITFESDEIVTLLEIVKGRGNVSPDEAIRYHDLDLGKGRARFQLSAAGVTPLRLDSNRDGRFETILQPAVHVRGALAKDTRPPEVTIQVLERNASEILIAIKAIDTDTGVKSISYTLDGSHFFPYRGPVKVKLDQSTLIYGIAEDNVGNRSLGSYEFNKH